MDVVLIILIVIGVAALYLFGLGAANGAEDSVKWSIVSIICGLFNLIVTILIFSLLLSVSIDFEGALFVLAFIIPAIIEIYFGLKGVLKWNIEKEEKTKQLLTNKQKTFTKKRRELVREINKLKLEQQGVLNQWDECCISSGDSHKESISTELKNN